MVVTYTVILLKFGATEYASDFINLIGYNTDVHNTTSDSNPGVTTMSLYWTYIDFVHILVLIFRNFHKMIEKRYAGSKLKQLNDARVKTIISIRSANLSIEANKDQFYFSYVLVYIYWFQAKMLKK